MSKSNRILINQSMNKTIKTMEIFLLIIFLIISFFYINSETPKARSNFHSSQLTQSYLEDEYSKRTEYRNSRGQLTIAADLGYAIKIVSVTEKGQLEKYYDDQGEPISRSDGYYAVLREYDEKGNNIRNTYLDEEEKPIMTHSGYAMQEREYNENNQVVVIKYFDNEGTPVCTPSYGYGRLFEYDDNGNNSKITYFDAFGNPMITNQGYASVSRNMYVSEGTENGKVESEFYFDGEGMPISLSLGQYGVHKEYNDLGQESVLTYLDALGNPMITNKGYTTVKRTFQANNSVATEQYYDLSGNPFSLSEGQYGVKQMDGQTDYLDQNGREVFNIKNLLYNHSRVVIPLVISFIVISALVGKKWNTIFLVFYICAIAYFTLMFRDEDNTKKTELLWYYRKVLMDNNARSDILRNIWLFIPLGTILFQLYPKTLILLIPFVFSVLIEGIQFISGLGFCELDDVISNSLGGCIGYMMGKLTTDIISRIKSWRHIHIS